MVDGNPAPVVQLQQSREEAPPQAVPGAAADQLFTFVAGDPGTGPLRLTYRRPWTAPDPKDPRFAVTGLVAR